MTIYTSPYPSVETPREGVFDFLLGEQRIAAYRNEAALIDATTGEKVSIATLPGATVSSADCCPCR